MYVHMYVCEENISWRNIYNYVCRARASASDTKSYKRTAYHQIIVVVVITIIYHNKTTTTTTTTMTTRITYKLTSSSTRSCIHFLFLSDEDGLRKFLLCCEVARLYLRQSMLLPVVPVLPVPVYSYTRNSYYESQQFIIFMKALYRSSWWWLDRVYSYW